MQNKITQLHTHNQTNLSCIEKIDVNPNDLTDAEATGLWLKKYTETPHTLAAYRKEAERFLLWLNVRGINLKQISVADVLAYQDFMGDPQPREKWCLEVERKWLSNGEANSKYRHSKKKARYLKCFLFRMSVLGGRAQVAIKRRS